MNNERVFTIRPGERFMTALVRTYYPAEYRKHEEIRKQREKAWQNLQPFKAGEKL